MCSYLLLHPYSGIEGWEQGPKSVLSNVDIIFEPLTCIHTHIYIDKYYYYEAWKLLRCLDRGVPSHARDMRKHLGVSIVIKC